MEHKQKAYEEEEAETKEQLLRKLLQFVIRRLRA